MANSEENSDILVEIPDEDLPELAKFYEKHKDWAPHAYSTITTGIEWKKKSKETYMTFLSPNNCWREDGTYFVLVKYHSNDIFIFSTDESGKNVYEALTKSKRFTSNYGDVKLDRIPLFFCVHFNIHPTVLRAIEDNNWRLFREYPNYMFSIPKEGALQFETECPPEIYIKKLDKEHADVVNSLWPHRYENSEKYVSLLIEMNNCYGAFLKSNDELVSWILLSMMGQLAVVQTVEGHKRKGYASFMIKYMSKEIAENGHNPFATVLLENSASAAMFKRLNFKSLGTANYILFSYNPDEPDSAELY